MIIEVGKSYRSRRGDKVEIIYRLEGVRYHPFLGVVKELNGDSVHNYTEDGTLLYGERKQRDEDVVGEWHE